MEETWQGRACWLGPGRTQAQWEEGQHGRLLDARVRERWGPRWTSSFPHIVNELRVVRSKRRKCWALGLGCLLFSFYPSTGQCLRLPHHQAEPWVFV